jgi:hypothetical protein
MPQAGPADRGPCQRFASRCCRHSLSQIPCLAGKIQGISRFRTPLKGLFERVCELNQIVGCSIPEFANREFSCSTTPPDGNATAGTGKPSAPRSPLQRGNLGLESKLVSPRANPTPKIRGLRGNQVRVRPAIAWPRPAPVADQDRP